MHASNENAERKSNENENGKRKRKCTKRKWGQTRLSLFLGLPTPLDAARRWLNASICSLNRSLMYPTHTQQIFRRVIVKFQITLISMM